MKTVVLMSSYNGEKYIRAQIDSILIQQCDTALDLVVRDDGSTDNTRIILQQYADAGKLQWYSGENLKPAKSFLDLVQHCPGYDYYAFADQDDYWYSDKLQSSIQLLSDKKCPAMSFANARLVDENLNPLGRNVYNRTPYTDFYSVVCGGGILGCTIAFNRQLAELLQTYNQPKKLIMHDSYTAIICTLFDGIILYNPQPYMDYRQHGSNVVGAQWNKWHALKNRFERIFSPQSVSIADMAQSILDQVATVSNTEKLQFLQQVSSYQRSLANTVCLSFSKKPRYNSKNMAITMRLAILLRNR